MKTRHLPLIIGISLPIIFIVVIAVVIFTPSFFVKPQYDFIYVDGDNYYRNGQGYQNTYKVENERIVLEPIAPRENISQNKVAPTLYLYDVKTNSSHQITLEEAQTYAVDPGPSSPDGYTVAYQYGHNGIFELFGSSSDNNGYFISKNNGKKKLSGLTVGTYYSSGGFNLIGWIKQ